MELSRSRQANSSSTSVDFLGIREDGLSGFHRARIPSLVVGAVARVGSNVRFCARSPLARRSLCAKAHIRTSLA